MNETPLVLSAKTPAASLVGSEGGEEGNQFGINFV